MSTNAGSVNPNAVRKMEGEGPDRTLEALLERVKGATGPSKELDCLVYCAMAESHFEYHGGDCVLAVQGGFAARLDWEDIPHPTFSLDAVVALCERLDADVALLMFRALLGTGEERRQPGFSGRLARGVLVELLSDMRRSAGEVPLSLSGGRVR